METHDLRVRTNKNPSYWDVHIMISQDNLDNFAKSVCELDQQYCKIVN